MADLELAEAKGILAELAVHERNAIHRASSIESCAVGDVLPGSNSSGVSVVFPIDAVMSLVQPLKIGCSVEVALFGNEGMLGLGVVAETRWPLESAVVQSAGFVYRMAAGDLLHQFHGRGRLQKSLLRFSYSLLGQIAQNAVCNRFHPAAARLAKWLLMVDDRGGRIAVAGHATAIGIGLGVDQDEAAEALEALAAAKAVRSGRRTIGVDRELLETRACECYEALRMSPAGAPPTRAG